MRIVLNYTNVSPNEQGAISSGNFIFDGVMSGSIALTATERPIFESILRRGCGRAHTLTITGVDVPRDPDDLQPGLFDNAPPD